jgi:hypothetical protein
MPLLTNDPLLVIWERKAGRKRGKDQNECKDATEVTNGLGKRQRACSEVAAREQ